jgi:Zn-dependent peptidase ImmA (M78 family)
MPKFNPQLFRWARESAGLTIEDAARAIGLSGANAVARLEEIEVGDRDPSRRQISEMAKKYRRPLLTFYLPAPPEPGEAAHDFRTLPDRERGSEALLHALVRDIKTRQALVRSALEDAEEDEALPFVGSVAPQAGPAALADAMRRTLHFDLATYRAARTIDDAFRVLRDSVEQIGLFVILMGNLGHHTSNLSAHVFRGFTIADPVAPFIVINETDSHSAWPFTLLHELGHVFLGEGGISGYDSDQAIERLCDEAAALFLLQYGEIRGIPTRGLSLADLIERIGVFANERKISRKIVAYNMLRSGTISSATYRQLTNQFDADRLEFDRQQRTGGAVDYYVVRRHRVGQGLVRLVDRLVASGILTATKAGKVLGVRPTAVGRMTEAVRTG